MGNTCFLQGEAQVFSRSPKRPRTNTMSTVASGGSCKASMSEEKEVGDSATGFSPSKLIEDEAGMS
jgi:hypothetical protein